MADISEKNNYDNLKVQTRMKKKLSLFKAAQNHLCMYINDRLFRYTEVIYINILNLSVKVVDKPTVVINNS